MSLVPLVLPTCTPRKTHDCGELLSKSSHGVIRRRRSRLVYVTSSSSYTSSGREIATFHKPGSDLVNFKPPPHIPTPSPQDFAAQLPFQFWYSYSDLPSDAPKRRVKIPTAIAPPASEEKKVKREQWLSEEDTNEDGSLKKKAIRQLVDCCDDSDRQINLGWKGWSINYVYLMHNYWKKSQVCKVKCKGAATLDMDSLCHKIEKRTGGKVIHRHGGALYVFRGLNYNYWENPPRPHFFRQLTKGPKRRLPLPCNLTKHEVLALRARGRDLPALCKLGKNGVYLTLLDDVRNAFQIQDLVRVNCQGLKSASLKILGAKLQALVPCELISYEFEHILMWRGKETEEELDTKMELDESITFH